MCGATPPWVQIPPVPPQKPPFIRGFSCIWERPWCVFGADLAQDVPRCTSEVSPSAPESAPCAEQAGSPVQRLGNFPTVVSEVELTTTSRCARFRSARRRVAMAREGA